MRPIFFISMTLLWASWSLGAELVLAENGTSDWQVVLAADAHASEQYAADVLVDYIEKVTGCRWPITDTLTSDTKAVIVGSGPALKKLGINLAPLDLGEQGFILRRVGDDRLVIAGGNNGGTLYGVYSFLEKVAGVRWYAPSVEKADPISRLTVDELSIKEKPAFDARWTSYAWIGKNADFLSRQRYNWRASRDNDPYGKSYSADRSCHSYFMYISPDEFYDDHPEYFSEIAGKRIRHETQLCLTNPEVLNIVTERMLGRMANRPELTQHNFSQMDYYNPCQCEKCQAMNERFGTGGGTQFWFVNELAKRTSQVYPDKLVGTLAYTFTEEPPTGMKMHPNTAVWLCHMFPCCDSHPIATCPHNADYRRRAEKWSTICDHLYIWHYIVDFAHYYNPFPNFRAMAADMRFYQSIGVECVFLQGMGQGGGGEFSLLRPYYGMKLLWNPQLDPEAVIDDFLTGYYGDAAQPIGEYIDMLHDKVSNDNIHMHLYTNPAQGYLTDDIMARAEQLFDQAEKLVKDDDVLLERVKVARMPLTYAMSFPRNGYTIEGNKLRFNGPIASIDDVNTFLVRMRQHGFQTIREFGGDPQQLLLLHNLFSQGTDILRLENQSMAVDVAPMLGGRIVRMIDKKRDKDVMANNVVRQLYFPFAGGIEARVGGLFNPAGWMEPAIGTQLDSRTLSLLGMTQNGLQLVREMRLDQEKPRLELTVQLINTTDKDVRTRLRSHGEFNLGTLQNTQVRFVGKDKRLHTVNIPMVIAGLREGVHYHDQTCAAGEIELTGDKGSTLYWGFDPQAVTSLWWYAYPDDLEQLEGELWLDESLLTPGQDVTMTQWFEFQ